VILLNDSGQILWSCSEFVSIFPIETDKFSYDYEGCGDKFEMTNNNYKLQITLNKVITGAELRSTSCIVTPSLGRRD